MANEEQTQPFVRREDDRIIFDLGELRRAAETGRRVLAILVEDIETAAKRVAEYAGSVKERAGQPAAPQPVEEAAAAPEPVAPAEQPEPPQTPEPGNPTDPPTKSEFATHPHVT